MTTQQKPIPVQPAPIPVRQPTAAELALKESMRKAVALGNHTYSIAQLVGVYPA